MPRNGRVIMVDPQIIIWKRKMRKFRRIKKEVVAIIEALSEDKRIEFWSTPQVSLKGKAPIEAIKVTWITVIEQIKILAQRFARTAT